MLDVLSEFPEPVVAIAARGKVTKADYEKVLVPRVEEMLGRHDKLRLYYELGEEFEGIEAGAVWEDLKIGFEHLSRWERVAVVTDVAWIAQSVRAFGFLFPAEIRIFPQSEVRQAREWINESAGV